MKLKSFLGPRQTVPAILAMGMFLYIVILIRPAIYAHHQQEAFLFASDFAVPFFTRAGGPSRLLGKLFMQLLYLPLPGTLLLFAFLTLICRLTFMYLRSFSKGPALPALSMIPGMLAMILLNNYNFPFPVNAGMFIVLAGSVIVSRGSLSLVRYLIRFVLSAAIIFYLTGPAFSLIFVLLAIPVGFRFPGRLKWEVVAVTLLVALAVILFTHDPFRFFPEEVYFKAYLPPLTFYAYLVSPALLAAAVLSLRKPVSREWLFPATAGAIVVLLAFAAHLDSYSADAHRVAACDYYCYHGDADRTARMATSLEDYSFAANLNYNLVMGKTGQLSGRFFDFFQIRGTMSLQPDIDYASELAFTSADFYYDLGFLSEARHWAYEALVFYPYSPRALEMLVRVHTILGEYTAAQRTLNILGKGIVRRDLIRTYGPLLKDTALIARDREIMDKRSCIPVQKELNPYMEGRFRELLNANGGNTRARDFLLIYYLMEGDLDAFSKLCSQYGLQPGDGSPVFEEGLLLYRIENNLPPDTIPLISEATHERFRKFSGLRSQYAEDKYKARNVLYWEMGTTYFYYYYYLYPRIIKPELSQQDEDEIPI